uniref:HIG1 domain-containing protein n=1 Tax=Globisporangium ultimum (strain ATCC 200006 / CBS 805.95 / DAOM BR144) TaxID=431595 RepID=K3WXT6_GLOUD
MQKAIEMKDSKEARDIIAIHAYTSGLKAGAIAASIMGTGVYTANKNWTAFRTRLGISGKWGLVVSSFLGAFTVVSEKRLLHGARDPQKYLESLDPNYVEKKFNENRKLKAYQRVANFVYDYPYRTLATVGVPLVGGIFALQTTNHAIARSQQIMHTRIYGQGAVVLLLLSSMAFHDYMATHGRFVAPDEDEEHAEHEQASAHHHAL